MTEVLCGGKVLWDMETIIINMQVTWQFKLPALVKEDKGYFVSWCPPIDVFSQGKTKKEALKNLVEALTLFFTSCFERGTLEKVFSDAGFKPIEGAFKKEPFPHDYEMINVPLPFQIKNKDDSRQWLA